MPKLECLPKKFANVLSSECQLTICNCILQSQHHDVLSCTIMYCTYDVSDTKLIEASVLVFKVNKAIKRPHCNHLERSIYN